MVHKKMRCLSDEDRGVKSSFRVAVIVGKIGSAFVCVLSVFSGLIWFIKVGSGSDQRDDAPIARNRRIQPSLPGAVCSDSIGKKRNNGFSGRRFNPNQNSLANETVAEQFVERPRGAIAAASKACDKVHPTSISRFVISSETSATLPINCISGDEQR